MTMKSGGGARARGSRLRERRASEAGAARRHRPRRCPRRCPQGVATACPAQGPNPTGAYASLSRRRSTRKPLQTAISVGPVFVAAGGSTHRLGTGGGVERPVKGDEPDCEVF